MVYIGNIYVIAAEEFSIHDTDRALEQVAALGTEGIAIGEFNTSLPAVDISGYLLKKYSTTRTLNQLVEDLNTLSHRSGAYNYCYNVRGSNGWVFPSNVTIPDSHSQLRDFAIAGVWYDYGMYTTELNCNPTTRTNSFSITGENWVTIPKGASYSGGDGSTETVASEDGNLTRILSDSSNVRFDLAAIEASVGEVRVLDGTTQIFNRNHVFAGNCHVSNGLYKVSLAANTITVYYWSGSAYTKIDDFTAGTFSSWYLTEVNPDIVKVQTSNGIKIEVERGRVPFIATGSVTLTCGSLTPANQTTSTDNYLILGTNMYVAGDTSFSIASNVISAGNRWIFYAASGVADVAQNCLTISNLRRTIVERWTSW